MTDNSTNCSDDLAVVDKRHVVGNFLCAEDRLGDHEFPGSAVKPIPAQSRKKE